MHYNRPDENGKPPPRSSRIFNMESAWYFSTREGADIGPFNSQIEAYNGILDFIQFIQLANKATLQIFLSTLSSRKRRSFSS